MQGRRTSTHHAVHRLVAIAVLMLTGDARLYTRAAWGSGLLAPAIGAADNATQGTRIADPHDPSAALFENPAGLARFDHATISSSMGIAWVRTRLEASAPPGYTESNTPVSMVPDFGVSIPYRDRWRFALGSYGTSGSTFDFDAEPSLGVPGFFSETIIAAFPLGVAYRLTDTVSLGAEVQPIFGQVRTHYELGGLKFDYKVNGPGIQGMFGVSVRPTAAWAFGLGLRTPGMVWMGGSMPIPSVGLQHVHVDLQMPTQVLAGVTWRGMPRLTLSASARFTNSSSFRDSTIEFELTPQANASFVADCNDEWRFGLAGEYAVRDDTWLRGGVSWASYIVGSQGVSPLVYDVSDTKLSIGVGHAIGRFVFDAMAGYAPHGSRDIPPERALILPGKYSTVGGIFMLGFTYRPS